MAMNLDPMRLTSADPQQDAERQYAELRAAEDYLINHNARTMVDFTGRGRRVMFEAEEMLLAVRAAKDRVHATIVGGTAALDAADIPDPKIGFSQPSPEGTDK